MNRDPNFDVDTTLDWYLARTDLRLSADERDQLRTQHLPALQVLTEANPQTFLRIANAAIRETSGLADLDDLARRCLRELRDNPHLRRSASRLASPLADQQFLEPSLERLVGPAITRWEAWLPSSWQFFKSPPLDGLIGADLGMLNPEDRVMLWFVRPWTAEDVRELAEQAEDNARYWTTDGLHIEGRRSTGSELLDTIHRCITLWDSFKDHFGVRVLDDEPGFQSVLQVGLVLPLLRSEPELRLLRRLWDRFVSKAPIPPGFRRLHLTASRVHPILAEQQLGSRGALLSAIPPRTPASERLLNGDMSQRIRSLLTVPDIRSRRSEPLVMDSDQRKLATERTASGYRRVLGPAGSGKSLILAARAAHLVAEERRVLVLSFNITLKPYLRELYLRHAAQLQVNAIDATHGAKFLHFHGYLKELASLFPDLAAEWSNISSRSDTDEAEEKFGGQGPNTEAMIALASRSLQRTGPMFDAVLVDEGQDWEPAWWDIVRKSHRSGGECLLVADATQDLYGRSGLWSDAIRVSAGFSGEPKKLTGSHRLHPNVIDLLAAYASVFLDGDLDLPTRPQQLRTTMDTPPTLRLVRSEPHRIVTDAAHEIAHAHRFIESRDDLSIPDILFTVDRHDVGEQISVKLEMAHHLKVQDVFRLSGPGHTWVRDRQKKLEFGSLEHPIKGTTIHSAKGWESRAVVAVLSEDDESADVDRRHRALYVAISRLKAFASGSIFTLVTCTDAYDTFLTEHGFVDASPVA